VKRNNQWVTYIKSEAISCWVGCVGQMLFPGEYSVLVIFFKGNELKKYLFRIKMKINDKEIFSNIANGSFD
jgi:hypothetical protein